LLNIKFPSLYFKLLDIPPCILKEDNYEYDVILGEADSYQLVQELAEAEWGELASQKEYEFLTWFLQDESRVIWKENGTVDYVAMYYIWPAGKHAN